MKFTGAITGGLTLAFVLALAGLLSGGNASEPARAGSSAARFYQAGKTPPALKQKNARPARLLQSPHMKSVALVDYALQMTVDTDENVDKVSSSRGSTWSSSSSSGSVKYIPRIVITAKNKPLPKDCLLVIEYFSQVPSSKSKHRRECVEHVSMPEIGKGAALTIDAEGVEFHVWEHQSKSAYGHHYTQSGGLEFYGVIVSLFQGERILIQMCTPQALNKECADTIPSPQAYEDDRSRRYYGW